MWWQMIGEFPNEPRSATAIEAGRSEEQNYPWGLRGTSHADTFIYPEKLISIFWSSVLYKNKFALL